MSLDDAFRDLLLRLPPEDSHDRAMQLLALAQASRVGLIGLRARYGPRRQRPVRLLGLTFPNPVGLAAGYDKDARAWRALGALGFGHVEVGTITPKPQPGNDRPRVFRSLADRVVINRLGFPSQGADAAHERLSRARPHGVVLGVNLGKNKATPNEEAGSDYAALVRRFVDVADYLVVNVSSPNTPGLRALQSGPALRALLGEVVAARDGESGRVGRRVPLLVKLSPDLEDRDLDDALGAVSDARVDGVIATNTTLSREGLSHPIASESGGMSGALLTARALEVCRSIRRLAGDGLPLISVGGILSADDAKARVDAGADLVQVYTGLVFGGPGFVRDVIEAL